LIVNGDEAVQDLLKDKNFMLFDWLDDRERFFAAVRNADIVFIDSYLADCALYEKVSNIAGTGVYFDDNIRIEYPKGFVLNGAIFAERMPYPKRNGVTYLLGVGYAPLRREFWDVPEKSIRDNLEIVMITFGGADIRNLTPKVLKLLVDTYPKLFKKVIIGKGFCNTAEIEELKDKNTELIYYPNAAEMKKIMLESDVAISAGGQTLYELARVGVPTIAVAVADNQLYNIRGWQKRDFIEYSGCVKDKRVLENILLGIETLRENEVRIEKSSIGRKLVDGKGSLRARDFLLHTE
jgi:spore coat polysaccharide biosynthesis predicted glycosyltransferase SpsG